MRSAGKKRKLAYIIHGLGVGGAELACLSALPALHQRFDLRVYVLGRPNRMLMDDLEEDLIQRMKFYPFSVYKMLFALPFLYASLRLFKPDIIVSSLWRSSVIGWLYKFMHQDLKYFVLLHSTAYFHWADRFFTTRGMYISDAVFADSKATGQFAKQVVGDTRDIHVLSYLLVAPPAEMPQRRFASTKYFLFVGRLNRVKRVPLAVKAIASLREAGVDAILHIYGRDDGGRADVEHAVRHYGLQEVVMFKGELNPKEKQSIYASYDFYIQLSAQEGMAMSVAEAMQYGAVCIVTPVGSIPQYAIDGYSAIFVDPSDELTWNNSMQQVMNVVMDAARCNAIATAAFNTFKDAPVFANTLIAAIDRHVE